MSLSGKMKHAACFEASGGRQSPDLPAAVTSGDCHPPLANNSTTIPVFRGDHLPLQTLAETGRGQREKRRNSLRSVRPTTPERSRIEQRNNRSRDCVHVG